MKTDTFVKIVMGELLKSPDVSDNSFFRGTIRDLGRRFEAGSLGIPGVIAALEQLLPWQLSRDIKKDIEKLLR